MRAHIVALSLFLSTPAVAATYNVDIFAQPPEGVTVGPIGFASTNACSATICAGGFNAAYSFQAQPGDTINFGTLTLSPFIFGDGRNLQSTQYLDENGQLQFGVGVITSLYSGSLVASLQYVPFIQLVASTAATCNSGNPSCFPNLQSLMGSMPPKQYDLTFTLPTGFIELGWTKPFTYTPPESIGAVPESSTWAMLLIGFGGLGFAAYRRGLTAKRRLRVTVTVH